MTRGEYLAVAMSGGVDSSMAAARLISQGHRVVGVTMLRDRGRESLEMAEEARRVASFLEIPHRVVELGNTFSRCVIEPFVDRYVQGLTPNPCVMCNPRLKFGALLGWCLCNGAWGMATGHYARVDRHPSSGEMRLLRGVDPDKDQSYALYRLRQAHLRRVRFPLGGLHKSQVRNMAKELGLPVAEKSESQEICFVPGDYRSFIREAAGDRIREGPILDVSGREIGRHLGLAMYTVGQRRGLNIPRPGPHYVVRLDRERNALVVGSREDLKAGGLLATALSWVRQKPHLPLRARVRIRYSSPFQDATIQPRGEDSVRVLFDRQVSAVAPGQSAVFYRGPEVLGGGVITDALK